MSELVFVTTDDCHFCEQGRGVLDSLGVERREIADSSDEAAALAASGIPLSFMPVLIDGQRVIAYAAATTARHPASNSRAAMPPHHLKK